MIRILESVAADPERYTREEHYANIYAVTLLGHFQEPAAHLPLIRAFLIPDEYLEELWGDLVTVSLPPLLFQTCNGDLGAIRDLILNRQAQEYVRGSAVEAMSYAVVKGMADREEVITFLAGLLTGTEAAADSYFWSNIVSTISDLHPAEAMEPIRKAFEAGLVDPGYIGLHTIETDLSKPREKMMAELRVTVDHRIPRDVHDYMSWFACFQESAQNPPRPVNCVLKKQQNKKKKNRVKSKQAKKARRKKAMMSNLITGMVLEVSPSTGVGEYVFLKYR